ncbi:sulfatase-like hydrolase/transferase [Phaeobacter sp. J2-8]|uniref:sulfatase-like hydrolase/transferase n=1 Tax=Phaeobacter sp. J2-8 TaxID=2931394 RepID=UPI001FD3BAAF|nr:sulfatase-like hydrolase/transferase [Phaeobacter sp. J2-8]MCJ7873438.1 sulfatase-like hydrolase/transferase [Phaeobacter sp. J2-8]
MTHTRPNVLLICTDHWAAEHLGFAGNSSIITPGLNELSACGVRYSNAYSECPVCIPARRTLMTGQSPRTHGDRVFNDQLTMPDVTTMAQAFRDAGYQADAVGKLHVHPQRDRVGFDSVLLDDEGRPQWGTLDDYDIYLGDQGLPGRQFDHGMSNNQYNWRPWHLDEEHHATNWAGRMMARTIKRRDPNKPGFWYLGFRHPHPPLVPPQAFIDLYRDVEIEAPYVGDWAKDGADRPFAIQAQLSRTNLYTKSQMQAAKRAFYALCSQIDYQIRYLVGTLRLEGILDDTIIMFTSDHGDMLGNHDMAAKRIFYESSANIPMILSPNKGNPKVTEGVVDDRLVGFADVMPTLLDLCDIEPPETVDGISMVGAQTHDHIYGECGEDDTSSRMIRDARYKLIYYPVGNHSQLFDLDQDPREMVDLARDPAHAETLARLQDTLIGEMYGVDLDWIDNGALVGKPDREYRWAPHRSLNSQRGDGWPPSPKVEIQQIEWTMER